MMREEGVREWLFWIRDQISERGKEELLRPEVDKNLNILPANPLPCITHSPPRSSIFGVCVSCYSIPEISDVSISSPLEKGTREIGDPG